MRPVSTTEASKSHAGPVFLGIFVVLALGIIAAGYVYYRHFDRQYHASVESQLSAVADLKAGELVQWRKERMEDARMMFQNPTISDLVRRLVEGSEDVEAERHLQIWIGKMRVGHDFDAVRLLDVRGVTRLSSPVGLGPMPVSVAQEALECLKSGKVTFQDFYRSDTDGRVYHGISIPIFDDREAGRPMGILYLRTDPETYLYPFIERWPVPSLTAETLLLRREGDRVLFLNELRHGTNAALAMGIPMSQTNLPGVRAALGETGPVEGIDYRGVRVMAALRAVSDSPWFLVAKIDHEEIHLPSLERLWQLVVLVATLVLGSGSCIGFIWRQQGVRFYQDRARVAEAARRSEQRFRTYFELPLIGIAVTSPTKGWVEANEELCRILGYSVEKLRGMTWAELTHPGDLDADTLQFNRVLAGEADGYSLEKRFVRADGCVLHSELAVRCVRNPSGEVEYFVALVKDITERKQAMEAARLSALRLEDKNAEMERFLYAASHDLKSPVVTIRTFLGYLEQDVASANAGRMEKDMHYIRSAADKIARLLDELLEVSRVGRLVNPPASVGFRALVDDALTAVAGRIADRGVVVTVGEHDLTLHGDPLRLAEIWQNLVENACKFMGDQKKPRVDIGMEVRAGDRVFYVRDNGIGVDPRHQAKIFNLFEKLDPKAEGTGMGLALVKRIVELYHGILWVESEGQGRGVCFYFTLPGAVTNGNGG